MLCNIASEPEVLLPGWIAAESSREDKTAAWGAAAPSGDLGRERPAQGGLVFGEQTHPKNLAAHGSKITCKDIVPESFNYTAE